VKKITYKKSNI